jgi:hypothetical protein
MDRRWTPTTGLRRRRMPNFCRSATPSPNSSRALSDLSSIAISASTRTLAGRRPDKGEEFIIDRWPNSRLIVASPCSGHGAKFAPAIGQKLARLALDQAYEASRFFSCLGALASRERRCCARFRTRGGDAPHSATPDAAGTEGAFPGHRRPGPAGSQSSSPAINLRTATCAS